MCPHLHEGCGRCAPPRAATQTSQRGRIPHRALRARPPLILVASDQEPATAQFDRVLTQCGYTVFRAHTGRLALAAARSAQPDVVILDEMLPETDGFEVCRTMRDDPEIGPSTPILMRLQEPPTPYTHRAALRAGVWEFLSQPIHDVELRARVETYVLMLAARPETLPADERDATTGLYAPDGLTRRARELALQAFHHHSGLGCMMIAPTRRGDGPRLADHLRQSGRRSDAIGRMSEDEFAIVGAGLDARGALLLAERLQRELTARAAQDRAAVPDLRAGFDTVADVRQVPLAPGKLLTRAALALDKARTAGRGDWIRVYESAQAT